MLYEVITIEKYFGSIPKGQAINMYRDWELLSDDAFEGKYGVKRSSFDANNFLKPKDKAAAAKLKELENKAIEIPRPGKAKEQLTTVIKVV